MVRVELQPGGAVHLVSQRDPYPAELCDRTEGVLLQVQVICTEKQGAQAADDVSVLLHGLEPGHHAFPFQPLPQHVVDILDTQDHEGCPIVPVRDHLHQVPAEIVPRPAAVDQAERLLSRLGRTAKVLQTGERDEPVYVLRVDRSTHRELLQLGGERPFVRLPALRVGPEHIAAIRLQVHMQDLPIGVPAAVDPRRHRDHERGHAVLPNGPDRGDIHHPAIRAVVPYGPALPPIAHGQQRTAAARPAPDLVTRDAQTRIRRRLSGPFIKIEDPTILLPDDVDSRLRHRVEYLFKISALQVHPSIWLSRSICISYHKDGRKSICRWAS